MYSQVTSALMGGDDTKANISFRILPTTDDRGGGSDDSEVYG